MTEMQGIMEDMSRVVQALQRQNFTYAYMEILECNHGDGDRGGLEEQLRLFRFRGKYREWKPMVEVVWGCKVEAKSYNPMEKKLDSRTVGGYFVGYLKRTKGYRFYCPQNTTRFVETQIAVLIKSKNEATRRREFRF
ncbi:unnamed protein product [Prunus brigantina]